MRTYTPQFFIKRLSAIADSKWTTNTFRDGDNPAKRCAFGHCGVSWAKMAPMGHALWKMFPSKTSGTPSHLASINDCPSKAYPQKTPKARVLAALRALPKDTKVRL